MKHLLSLVLIANCLACTTTSQTPIPGPIIIAHRGASGYLPEHTLAAYAVAAFQGADFLEPDLVMTKDGILIARHDNALHLSTDIATRQEFADRKRTKMIDGREMTGWFSEDFSFTEIQSLRAIERIPDIRPQNRRFDGQFTIPNLEEIISLCQSLEKTLKRPIGLYPEIKHPSYFQSIGLGMEEPLVAMLHKHGYRDKKANVFIQSFEVDSLKKLRTLTDLPLVQLLWIDGQPYDQFQKGSQLSYQQMASAAGLKEIATYAEGVGPEKEFFILRRKADGSLDRQQASDFIKHAHAAGLIVHPYTFRAENFFLPSNFQTGDQAGEISDLATEEMKIFLELGIDGFFTDHPDLGVKARQEFLQKQVSN
ncbi:MAG: glycerophosphodiester phosphodiesterase [Oligoflexus sp.]